MAAGTSGGIGTNLAVIIAYLWLMPEQVAVASSGLVITLLVVLTAYLIPEKEGE